MGENEKQSDADPFSLKNEDVGFVRIGQLAQVKLAAYPFQKYGMLAGRVVHVSADASDSARASAAGNGANSANGQGEMTTGASVYKARVQLDNTQSLQDPQGQRLELAPGMQVVAEINEGKQTVLEYLLSPVQKAIAEAGRER